MFRGVVVELAELTGHLGRNGVLVEIASGVERRCSAVDVEVAADDGSGEI